MDSASWALQSALRRAPTRRQRNTISSSSFSVCRPRRSAAPGGAPAIDECRKAGIRVVMITGDYPQTARAIARQIGLTPHRKIITGS